MAMPINPMQTGTSSSIKSSSANPTQVEAQKIADASPENQHTQPSAQILQAKHRCLLNKISIKSVECAVKLDKYANFIDALSIYVRQLDPIHLGYISNWFFSGTITQ